MTDEYRNNHYVPEWYQKRFLPTPASTNELFYLDLNPEFIARSDGVNIRRRDLKLTGFKHAFAQRDLYTRHFASTQSTAIEKFFFGDVDTKGQKAVECLGAFEHPSATGPDTFNDLLAYLTTQKLRTPKGLQWLASAMRSRSRNDTLQMLTQLRRFYGAIWSECVWQIADASPSETKFIVSDHPVTIYNRRCTPRSIWCRAFRDPEITQHASHTIFPLSLDRVLVMTNLSWVRNPYQSELGVRPNPNPLRSTMFNFTRVQTRRLLNETEVRQINLILKSRAWRYVAAARKEWLFPESHMSVSDWRSFGDGYLLMPDPREIHMGGDITIGYRDGSAARFDEYGHRPGDPDPRREARYLAERQGLHRHQGEFARRHGPFRRGRSWREKERDSERLHEYFVSLNEHGVSTLDQ
jgi:hypothetical protein